MRFLLGAFSLLMVISTSMRVTIPDPNRVIMQQLVHLTDEEALAMGDSWQIPGWHTRCIGAPALAPAERTVLLCQWGTAANAVPEGHHIIWREGEEWLSQPYPRNGLRGKAHFTGIYQSGNELIAVLDVAPGFTRYAEQPQLLRRSDTKWDVIWLPDKSQWSPNAARVSFTGSRLDHFTVMTDRHVFDLKNIPFGADFYPVFEQWRRAGDRFQRIAQVEPPTAQTALIHFTNALVKGDTAEAERWVTAPHVLAQAKDTGYTKQATFGFTQPEQTERTVNRLTILVKSRNYEGIPRWLVATERAGNRWLISNIAPVKPTPQ